MTAAISCACLLASSLAFAEPKAGNVESAKALVTEGRELRSKGDHKAARDRFRAAFALVPTPIIGLDLANEHIALGELIEARQVCLEIDKLPANSKESSEGTAARGKAAKLADELRARIASITVVVVGLPADVEPSVSIDGQAVPSAALGNPIKVNPGKRVIVARVGDTERSKSLVLGDGQSKEVRLEFPPLPANTAKSPAPAADSPKESRPKESGGSRMLVYTGFGVGAAGLIIGGVTLGVALSKRSSLLDACPSATGCRPADEDQFTSDRSLFKSMRVVSVASFAVGLAGLAVGTYGLLSTPSNPEAGAWVRPLVGWGVLGVHGGF